MLQCRPTFGIPHLELVILKASQPVQAGVGGPLLQVVWVGGHAQHLQPAGGCRPATRPCTQCTDLVCSDGLQCVAVSKGRPGAACPAITACWRQGAALWQQVECNAAVLV